MILGYGDSQWEILAFLEGPGEPGRLRGPWGLDVMKAKAKRLPTSCLSAHSIGTVYPYCVGIPRPSRVEGHSRRDVRGVPGYLQRKRIVVEEGEEGMEARGLCHPETDCSTLNIKLTLH